MRMTKCAACGKDIEVSDEIVPGQHVRCPYCGGKFSYLTDTEEFSEERMSYAIQQCLKDPNDALYYVNAPSGAKLYIGMLFYGKTFKQRVDVKRYFAALTELEPDLKCKDWQYLFSHENDPELAAYYHGKVEALQESSAVVPEEVPVSPSADETKPPVAAVNPAVDRRLKIEENRLKMKEAQAVREWRRKLVGNIVTLVGVVVVSFVGWKIYSAWKIQRHSAELAVMQERARIEAENRRVDSERREKEAQERRRREEERSRQEQQRIEERQREAQKAEERQKSAEMEEVQAREKRERELAGMRAGALIRERYDAAVKSFEDDGVRFWDDLKAPERPGAADGIWYCAVPGERGGFELYEVSRTNAQPPQVALLTAAAAPSPVDREKFDEAVARRGGIYACGDESVVRGVGPSAEVAVSVPAKDALLCVGDEAMGRFLPLLKALKVDVSDIKFDIVLRLGKEKLDVARVDVDDQIGREPFEEAVRQYLTDRKVAQIDARSVSLKKPRVTVVEYDGEIVRKGANGVTEVPRRFMYEGQTVETHYFYHTWGDNRRCNCSECKKRRKIEKARGDWEKLCETARRQAAEMAEYKKKLEEILSKRKKSVSVSESELLRAMKSAKATYRRLVVAAESAPVSRKESCGETKAESSRDGAWTGDAVPRSLIQELNARLSVKSFCGIAFGEVMTDIGPCCGRGGRLQNKFRLFDSYSAYGTASHRVNRIELRGRHSEVVSRESVDRELDLVMGLLEKKYNARFGQVFARERSCRYEAESPQFKITLSCYTRNTAEMTLSFLNKEVDGQEETINRLRPKKEIDIPKDAGFDVL